MTFALPAELATGTYELNATVAFSTGESQQDSFPIHVLPRLRTPIDSDTRIALFDPKGETAALLENNGNPVPPVGGG